MALRSPARSRRRLPGSRRHDVVNPDLAPGAAWTVTYRVCPQDLVTTLFPDAPEFARKPAVLATGILVALCEWPAMNALRQFIGDDEDSLGTAISLSHQAPVSAGTLLTLTARCISVTGRISRWEVNAHDGTRLVACGWAEFAVVRTAAFLERYGLTPTASPPLRRMRDRPEHRDLVSA
ncbi:MAG: thioesterase family protein [Pseudonocardiaceae bacterium]